jgi:hypothetical protein
MRRSTQTRKLRGLSLNLHLATKVEELRAIDLAWLRRRGARDIGYSGRITWSRHGEETASIGYDIVCKVGDNGALHVADQDHRRAEDPAGPAWADGTTEKLTGNGTLRRCCYHFGSRRITGRRCSPACAAAMFVQPRDVSPDITDIEHLARDGFSFRSL